MYLLENENVSDFPSPANPRVLPKIKSHVDGDMFESS